MMMTALARDKRTATSPHALVRARKALLGRNVNLKFALMLEIAQHTAQLRATSPSAVVHALLGGRVPSVSFRFVLMQTALAMVKPQATGPTVNVPALQAGQAASVALRCVPMHLTAPGKG